MTRPLPVPTTPDEIAALLHEAVVYGYTYHLHPVVGRRRPFLSHGTDPADVNRECARRYEVSVDPLAAYSFCIEEVDASDVIPFRVNP